MKWTTVGFASAPPAASANTSKRCFPGFNPFTLKGDEQALKPFPSTLQRKLAPFVVELKRNVAVSAAASTL